MHPTRIINSHELIFVKQGELDMWEEDRTFHLEAGQTLHLWPGRQHGSTKPMPLGLKFYWIHFDVMDCSDQNELQLTNGFVPAIKVPQISRIPQPQRLERLFRNFLEDQETRVLHPYSANLLTTLMLMEVSQSVQEQPEIPDNVNVVATWAHTYIRVNYDQAITTSKIAETLGYNADYLGRIYREAYGCTVTEAIHQRRISKACDFLLESGLSLEQITLKCGFNDPDYFRRVFKRYVEISPSEYRKEYSRLHVMTHTS
jgi:YesN/AraC family two-component response regulator